VESLTNISDVSHLIQLAIAPVFLLTAVGSIINVLTSRLARVVDRGRRLDEASGRATNEADAMVEAERGNLRHRLWLIYLALASEVCCALFVGLLIATGFVGAALGANLALIIAFLFILAMTSFVAGLAVFLREIFLAVSFTRHRMR
jgi:hypothetical protein